MQELTGTTIGRYRLRRRIAEGGMSEVYLAQDRKTAREVAIKLVHADDDFCMHFQREVSAISALQHEHILPALDYGKHESWLYLVTPYVAQGTLDEHLVAGPLSCHEANEILQQLADALQFAHEHGIIHCDIKPSNVLLADGWYVYLADFGLMESGRERWSVSQSGFMVGTPAYMAPEVMDGPATSASDIYALGVLLYQMLTGQLPFQADTPLAIVWKHVHEEPVPPSTLNPALSSAIDGVILRALEKDPGKRFETPRELALAYQDKLHRLVDAAPAVAIQPSIAKKTTAVVMVPTTSATRRKKKKAVLLTTGLGTGVCAAALLFGIFTSGLQHQPSYSSNIPDRPAPMFASPHRPNAPSTGVNGAQMQSGNTSSQGQDGQSQGEQGQGEQGQGEPGQRQPLQSSSTISQPVVPTPPISTLPAPTPPAPTSPSGNNGGHGHGKAPGQSK